VPAVSVGRVVAWGVEAGLLDVFMEVHMRIKVYMHMGG
jgi:hypothetical protein